MTRDNPTFAWKDTDAEGDEYTVMVSVLSQDGVMMTLRSLGEAIALSLSDEQAKRIAAALMPPAADESERG